MPEQQKTFIVACARCNAKVAATERGCVLRRGGVDEEGNEHYGKKVLLGECPSCRAILVGEAQQLAIAGFDSYQDEWGEAVRIYPEPAKCFSSSRIPKAVSESMTEAEKVLQASSSIAACVMLGRALEGICRDLLGAGATGGAVPKHVMLGEGIRRLKDEGFIDQRLYDWSQQLHAFRNLAAHPSEISISREDAKDLQSFVHAIIEYVYDLTDRYNQFKERLAKKNK